MKKAQGNSDTESSDDEKSYKWTEGKIYKWVKQPGFDKNGCEMYRRKSTKPGRYEFKYVRPESSESIRRIPESSEFIRRIPSESIRRMPEFSESIRRIPSESIRRMPESSESIRCIPSESIRRMPESSEFIRFNSGSRGKSSEAFERKVNCNSRGESSGERILEFSESIRRIPDNSSKGKPFSSMSDCKTQSPSFQEEKDGCCIS